MNQPPTDRDLGQQIETHTHINTKSRDRKRKQQEELTGFDVEGHRVGPVLVGGIAESGDVRGDLDANHTLNAVFRLCLGYFVEDLAQNKTHSLRHREKQIPFLLHWSDLKS